MMCKKIPSNVYFLPLKFESTVTLVFNIVVWNTDKNNNCCKKESVAILFLTIEFSDWFPLCTQIKTALRKVKSFVKNSNLCMSIPTNPVVAIPLFAAALDCLLPSGCRHANISTPDLWNIAYIVYFCNLQTPTFVHIKIWL